MGKLKACVSSSPWALKQFDDGGYQLSKIKTKGRFGNINFKIKDVMALAELLSKFKTFKKEFRKALKKK